MKIINCRNCGKSEEHQAFGLCFNCYRKQWKPQLKTCVYCKQQKVIHARGHCAYCYNKVFYKEYYRMASRKQSTGVTKEVFEKLDKKCMVCGFDKIIDVHHLVAKSKGGSHDLSNLIILCPNHHKMMHHADYREEMTKMLKEKLDGTKKG